MPRQRDVTASYMIPAPVWKSSYRLIFGATGQPMLEGWAIVDNTTGEDWTKVQFSLVSGRPISFVSQLYAPKYVTAPGGRTGRRSRPRRPVVHEGGIRRVDRAAAGADAARRGAHRLDGRYQADDAGSDRCQACRCHGQRECRAEHHRRRRRPRANSASSSNTASPSPSPSARTNPPCCRSCSSRSTRASS